MQHELEWLFLEDSQTSVVTPAMIIWFLLVARTAARKSSLSQASIWPGREMRGASGYVSINSLGKGPFGPVSKDGVMTTGMLNSLPIAAWANMEFLKWVASQLRCVSPGNSTTKIGKHIRRTL